MRLKKGDEDRKSKVWKLIKGMRQGKEIAGNYDRKKSRACYFLLKKIYTKHFAEARLFRISRTCRRHSSNNKGQLRSEVIKSTQI